MEVYKATANMRPTTQEVQNVQVVITYAPRYASRGRYCDGIPDQQHLYRSRCDSVTLSGNVIKYLGCVGQAAFDIAGDDGDVFEAALSLYGDAEIDDLLVGLEEILGSNISSEELFRAINENSNDMYLLDAKEVFNVVEHIAFLVRRKFIRS